MDLLGKALEMTNKKTKIKHDHREIGRLVCAWILDDVSLYAAAKSYGNGKPNCGGFFTALAYWIKEEHKKGNVCISKNTIVYKDE